MQLVEPLQWYIKRPMSNHERLELKAPLFKALWDLVPTNNDPQSHGALLDHYLTQLDLVEVYNLNLKIHEDVVRLIRFWDGNKTLREFVNENFPRNSRPVSDSMFPITINAWTENIQDHLLLFANHGRIELRVFHLTSFLRIHKYSPNNQIYPLDLLNETEQTIALMFPPTDMDCRKWIRKARKEDKVDLEANTGPADSRNLQSYHYWGLRLLKIIEEYDRTEPTSLRQWAVDKRRPNQRYTFWIAVTALSLALVFGLIQSVTGIIQVILIAKQ
ncbi:hypothetical protein BDV09DRAFT_189301 [Aspergillus tetrazonus]